MGKLIRSGENTLLEVCGNIDIKKFNMPITEDILKKNGWESVEDKDGYEHWYPVLPQVYDEELGEWVEQDEDFEGFTIWYRITKEVWCYRYAFGTYVYDIKSIGELEIILAREGFVYEFDI